MAGITTMHPAYPGGHVEVNRICLESDRCWRKIIIKIWLLELYKGV